jgi:hypothetical protein
VKVVGGGRQYRLLRYSEMNWSFPMAENSASSLRPL